MMFVSFNSFLKNKRKYFAMKIFTKGDTKSSHEVACCLSSIDTVNNISVFFCEISTENLMFFKKSKNLIFDFFVYF